MNLLVLRVVRGRPRLFAGLLVGVAFALLLPNSFAPLTRALVAWDSGCLAFLVLAAVMFTSERHADIAADAAAQEEGEWTIFWLTVGAVTASFAAILGDFSQTKDMPAALRDLHIALVATTLFVSWLMTHTVFAYRYAHEYYERGDDGHVSGGLSFPDEQEPDYWDFFYFALVLGMTFQVSDVQITSRKLRRLAAAHGLLGFLFNTVILALSVNIGASLL
jgi:uncharacterized membrane protein